LYNDYLKLRSQNENTKFCSFYVDMADFFLEKNAPDLSFRILSNLAELELENPQFLRIIVFKLQEMGPEFYLLGIEILRRIVKFRPEEPQSYLYLAMALTQNGNLILEQDELGNFSRKLEGIIPIKNGENSNDIDRKEEAKKYYTEAIVLFLKVLLGKWDARLAQVEVPTLMELNRLANFVTWHGFGTLLTEVDKRFLAPVKVDLKITIIWDTDMTDVEIHVIEPLGEECYSFHNKTASGGLLSRNFTHGYGPQEYITRQAQMGTYSVGVKLFSSMNKYTGTTVLVNIATNFGDPEKEEQKWYCVRLENDKEMHHVAKIYFN